MTQVLAGESGWLVGFIIGLGAGIALTRWLWINGQKTKRRLRRAEREEDRPDDKAPTR